MAEDKNFCSLYELKSLPNIMRLPQERNHVEKAYLNTTKNLAKRCGHVNHTRPMTEPPPRRCGDPIVVTDVLDFPRGDRPQRVDTSQLYIVTVNQHLARGAEAVRAARVQPTGTQCLHRLIYVRIAPDLLLRKEVRAGSSGPCGLA